MKYMGSKRAMLLNGLGETLNATVPSSNRVVDLFTGSAAVAAYVAQNFDRQVVASDLQLYACALASAAISRTRRVNISDWWDDWLREAIGTRPRTAVWREAKALQDSVGVAPVKRLTMEARQLAAEAPVGSLTRAYGGYYFSPLQAMTLDALRSSLPTGEARGAVVLGALIQAASKCAAAPGHTAQPFKPNSSAGRFLEEAWSRDIVTATKEMAEKLGSKAAKVKGDTICGDALEVASSLQAGDLAFVDPPYSAVHYSRFYHVLEAIAQGTVGPVQGEGRYPPKADRPQSEFSVMSQSHAALDELFEAISERGASAIVTFPSGEASNGLSGKAVAEIAEQHFKIKQAKVSSRFSTLGGNKKHRAARQDAHELILSLSPK